jgi:hypothetical protein
MIERPDESSGLARHIDRLRRRQERRPRLEESLTGGRFARYALYRLRYVGAARSLALAVHLVELLFLTKAFSAGSLVLALVLQNGAALIGGFWWGALEELRHPLRDMRPDAIAAQLIERWLARARLLAAAVAGVAIAAVIAAGPAPLIAAYAAVVIGRLVVDLILRTYYSGVYARRRVYRPLSVIFLVEGLGLVVVLALWPLIGPWSFPIGFAAGVAASRLALWIYTRRAYRQIRQVEPHRGSAAPPASRAIILPGLAGIASRAGSLVVMALLFAGPTEIVLVAHAIVPLLTTAAGWPFVFYLDVVQLSATGARRLGRQLERSMLRLGAVVAAILVAATIAVLAALFGPGAVEAAVALAPVLVAQAILAALQLSRFARRDYRPVALGSLGLAAGLGAGLAAMTWAPLSPLVATASGAGLALLFAIVVTIAVRRPPPEIARAGVVDSGLEWLVGLRSTDGPVITGELALADRRAATRARALEAVAGCLGERGAVYGCAPGRLRWYVAGDRSPIDPRQLQLELAGMIDRFADPAAHPDAGSAARAVFSGPATPAAELIAAARQLDGALVARVGAPSPELAALEPGERQLIWWGALAAAAGRRSRHKGSYDVAAFAPGGVIEIIFALPRDLPGEQRSAFRRDTEAASAAATFAA